MGKIGVQLLKVLVFAVCFIPLAAIETSAAVPVAVFPLQELGKVRNDINLPFTEVLAQRLADSGNNIIGLETVIAFMANNRIRTTGHLDILNISRLRRDLGAAFVLLGTVTERKDRPEPSMGLVLNLVRTSDYRIIWTYIGSLSIGEERRILGIGEPQSTLHLQHMILDEIIEKWPWQSINEEQISGVINIDSAVLEPEYVRPGDEIHSRVRLRDAWPVGQAPLVYFKADDQLYPATISADGITYKGDWVAGEEVGSFPVILLMEWPHYGRTETALIGNYLIDVTPPLFDLKLGGIQMLEGMPVFNHQLMLIPQMIIREPLSKWRLAFYAVNDTRVGDMEGTGNLPQSFIWKGAGNIGDGIYIVEIEAWDLAGNLASASREVEMNRSLPEIGLNLEGTENEIFINLEHEGKVPLNYWRLEMWTKEGRMLTQAAGRELPVKIGIELPKSLQDQQIEGFLFYKDVLGKEVSKKVEDILPNLKEARKEEKTTGISEKWVEEF